jgi:hypothetical protein
MCQKPRPAVLLVLLSMLISTACFAERVHRPGRPHHPTVRAGVVFVGGYYYDPFFGPYPWWQPVAYPRPYFPVYDHRAEVRVLVTPNDAAVYVDGFYAGIVEDFDGFFERLPLPPGGHEIVLYLNGYRTARQTIYLHPGATFKLRVTMERLAPGERSELVAVAPMVPPPPIGTFSPPRTPPPLPLPAEWPPASTASAYGTLALQVQPAGCEVTIDGEPWVSSGGGHLVVQLSAGRHRVEIRTQGYQRFSTDIDVREGETTPLNVSLSTER